MSYLLVLTTDRNKIILLEGDRDNLVKQIGPKFTQEVKTDGGKTKTKTYNIIEYELIQQSPKVIVDETQVSSTMGVFTNSWR